MLNLLLVDGWLTCFLLACLLSPWYIFLFLLMCAGACGSASSGAAVMGLVIEAILFGLFTLCMMCDQYTTVTTNRTGIDRLKGDKGGKKASYMENVKEVFGGPQSRGFHYTWLLPVKPHFPENRVEQLFGYTTNVPKYNIIAPLKGKEREYLEDEDSKIEHEHSRPELERRRGAGKDKLVNKV